MTVGTHGLTASAFLDREARGTHPALRAPPRGPFADPGRLLVQTLDAIEDGLVVTDHRAVILHANRAARAIMAAGLLSQKTGILHAGTPAATRTLHDAIAGQDGTRAAAVLWLGQPCGRELVTVTVSRGDGRATVYDAAEPVVVVTIRRATPARLPSAEVIQATFDLTPSEARMAREVLKGDGVNACARRLGVAANTARTHLNRVFDKTGTKRQAELVRVLLSCRG